MAEKTEALRLLVRVFCHVGSTERVIKPSPPSGKRPKNCPLMHPVCSIQVEEGTTLVT